MKLKIFIFSLFFFTFNPVFSQNLKGIYVLNENDQMIDLLKKGQAVFGISLGPVHTETEAEIFSLFPEKISVQNR